MNKNFETNTEILSYITKFVLLKISSLLRNRKIPFVAKNYVSHCPCERTHMFNYTFLLDFRVFRMQYMKRNSKTIVWFSSYVGSAAL